MKEIEGMVEAIRELSTNMKESFFELGSSIESLSQSFRLMVAKMTVDSQMQQKRNAQEVPKMIQDTKEVRQLLVACQQMFGTEVVKQVLVESTGCDRLTDVKPDQLAALKNAVAKKLQEK